MHKNKNLSFRVSEDFYAQVKAVAEPESVSAFVQTAIANHLLLASYGGDDLLLRVAYVEDVEPGDILYAALVSYAKGKGYKFKE